MFTQQLLHAKPLTGIALFKTLNNSKLHALLYPLTNGETSSDWLHNFAHNHRAGK